MRSCRGNALAHPLSKLSVVRLVKLRRPRKGPAQAALSVPASAHASAAGMQLYSCAARQPQRFMFDEAVQQQDLYQKVVGTNLLHEWASLVIEHIGRRFLRIT